MLDRGRKMNFGFSMPDPTQNPARRWPRLRFDIPLRIIARKAANTAIVSGRGNELNAGGMALSAPIELEKGEVVSVEFIPPNSATPIAIRCRVCDRSGDRYGLEFLTESSEDNRNRNHIRAILAAFAAPM